MALSVTRVVNALLRSDEVYCPLHQSGVAVAGATNAVNTRQSEAVTVYLFFPPSRPHAFNPISPTHGHFVLSPVSLASRDQDGGTSDSTIHICTIAVMSYVADMSSDVMWNTEPIISCILSNDTQLKTGN